MDPIDAIIEKYPKHQRDNLIPIMQEIQEYVGYISEESVKKIGQHLLLSTSKIFGVATFYDNFRFDPKGKYHFQICRGTSCHLNESGQLIQEIEKYLKIKAGQITRDGMFSLEAGACMGACGVGPVMTINGEYHEKITFHFFTELLENLKKSDT